MSPKSENKKKKDEQFEICFFEGILKDSPDFIEALIALGDLYTKHNFYQKGLEVDQKLVQLRPEDPIVLYNLACSYSLVGHLERAFCAIQVAIARGYGDLDFLKEDADLKNLRNYAPFQDFLSNRKIDKAKI